MKILLITHTFPPAIDGGSRVIYKISLYLKKHHHQILVLTSNCHSTDDFVNPKSPPIKHYYSNMLSLPVYRRLRRPIKFLNLFIRSDTLNILQKGPIFKIIPLTKSLFQIIKFKPQLIIAGPFPTTIVLYANLIKKLTGAKLLINACFHFADPNFHRKSLISSLQSADYLWCQTDFETQFFHNNFNIPTKKLINIGSGIDQSLLTTISTKLPKNPNLLYVGAFAQHKNIEILIDIFTNLSKKYPKLTLTLAGTKTQYFHHIKDKIKTISPLIRSKIDIVLNFPNSKLIHLYDSCTILCQPSSQESFGLTLIEAWARKKPVCISRNPIFIEIINKTNGGLFLDQIEQLLDNPKLCRSLGNNGYRYVKSHYTWNQIGNKLSQRIIK